MFDPTKDGFGCTADIMQAWSDLAARTMQAAVEFRPESSPIEAGREVRSAMFKAWADAWDQYVRTPEFLGAIRASLAMGAQWRKLWVDFFSQWQQSLAGSGGAGAGQWTSAAELGQSQILAVLETMTHQLKHLGERIEAMERESEGRLAQGPERGEAGAKKPLKRRVSKNGRH